MDYVSGITWVSYTMDSNPIYQFMAQFFMWLCFFGYLYIWCFLFSIFCYLFLLRIQIEDYLYTWWFPVAGLMLLAIAWFFLLTTAIGSKPYYLLLHGELSPAPFFSKLVNWCLRVFFFLVVLILHIFCFCLCLNRYYHGLTVSFSAFSAASHLGVSILVVFVLCFLLPLSLQFADSSCSLGRPR